ncbi:WhiB family transcriptional regulator [Pseudonocardia sp. 73-21]|uniref:WhiB family transcriptional regulator n=1 Tax=Pseudonocardia sp. 73-21 TaxID=1895809 RepID=UPI000960CFA6|nr:WhiB family transcriptional regulator [Pseudonocardia sp. 73-21]OJY39278.1 MAG: transcriptional regulator [Pseudonocardia sp. 73-21]
MTDVGRLPAPITDNWDWQMRGACRDLDSAVFFHPTRERGPSRRARVRRAKEICETCPVIEECRRYSLATREPYGVWGGLSEAERSALVSWSS